MQDMQDAIAISPEELIPGSLIEFDLHYAHVLNGGPRRVYVRYRLNGAPLEDPLHEDVARRSGGRLFIRNGDAEAWQLYVARHLETLMGNSGLPRERRARLLLDSASGVMRQLFERPYATASIRATESWVRGTVDAMLGDDEMFFTLLDGLSREYFTYTHSVNVAIYGIALARRLGVAAAADLQDLGFGFLMHDIGKREIAREILVKPGKLTEEEMQQMRRHPELGAAMLQSLAGAPSCAVLMARHHHENWAGGGYPDGLIGEAIPREARMTAMIDVFDALTTDRAYRKGMGAYAAFEMMRGAMAGKFDPEMLETFITLFRRNEGEASAALRGEAVIP